MANGLRLRNWVLIAGAGLMLSACAGFGDRGDGRDQMVVTATDAMNGGMPLHVEILEVARSEIADRIAGLTASDWFGNKSAIEARHGEYLHVTRLELVPGTAWKPIVLSGREDVVALIVVADYAGRDRNLLRLARGNPLHLTFDADTFSVNEDSAAD